VRAVDLERVEAERLGIGRGPANAATVSAIASSLIGSPTGWPAR
jgi:hypothetical protein